MTEAAGSLHRSVALVRAIARGGEGGAALADIVAWTGLPRPTVHRVLDMLIETGWVERDQASRRFFLGREIYALGLVAAAHHPIERIAATELAALVQDIEQTVYLSVRAGLDTVCAARQESTSRIQTLVLKVGSQVPLGRGAGSMAILAALPVAEAEAIIRANLARYGQETEGFDEAAFRLALTEARVAGFASHDSLFTRGIAGIGVPVRDATGYPVAAISTAFVADWLDDAQRRRCVARLNETAERIGARLIALRSRP
ncbi:IclR family transcriptional regulator [Phreatobacter stygius]|uniref:IclR family transcriptional regulator n=1 Tax=Phreatobacter stygius TaxID=1940610 RepID=UPI001476AFDE|nr:IclR family transcriptional regulator [Phreatobacter stygius]